LDLLQLVVLPLIGVIAGVLGGLLGIGGGLVIIPALLIVLGRPFGDGSLHVYKIAALATAIVLSIPAAREHLKAGAVVRPMLPALEGFGVLGVIVGVGLAACLSGPQTRWLQLIFGLTMIAFVISNIWFRRALAAQRTREGASCPSSRRWLTIGLQIGLPAGVISGLLGIGGGAWAVPAQTMLLGIRLPNAIANSTCMILGVALAAAILKSYSVAHMADLQWTNGWMLALFLAPGAALGGMIGGRLAHRIPIAHLRTVFLALLLITGIRLLMT
jgi:uncharacterized membrane protein YfcA